MALNKQFYAYSCGTDAFYDLEEQEIHKKLLRLYKLRYEEKYGKKKQTGKKLKKNGKNRTRWLRAINKVIAKFKKELQDKLNQSLETNCIRELDSNKLSQRNVINLFESSMSRSLGIQIGELTEEIFVIDVYFFQILNSIVHNGFLYKGKKYRFLTASAGQIRQKKFVAIKEESYNKISKRLMCGLTEETINEKGGCNTNKLLSYTALSNSATETWEGFDIDKSIVVDDFETEVVDEVDYIAEGTYEITRKTMPVKIPHTDGAGIMLDKPTRMIRAPWIKGCMFYFPFDKFIQEYCGGECVVKDIWGKEHKIIEEDIRYILTKSQMKMYHYYDSWEQYKQYFKKYGCEVCYCNEEEEKIPSARINYQMLQTLTDITNEEIAKITSSTLKDISNIGEDYRTNMRLLGADSYNTEKNCFQQALVLYPELFRDTYHKDILKQTKKSYIKQARAGRLRVNGGYRFISPDLYAFCQWLFLHEENPRGLLENGEVFCEGFRDGSELACLRSPHLYREWCIRKNKKNDELKRWFDTKCLYTSCHDTISKILQ